MVLYPLEMPDSFPGFRVQSQHTIGEEIVSDSICPVEIEGRRAGGHIDNAALRIEGHPRPVVGRATVFPGVPGPGLDRKSTRLNSSHSQISYAVFCLKKKKNTITLS